MDFSLTARQKKFKEEVVAFVDGWDKEQIKALERDSLFPRELYAALSKRAGRVMVPPEFGGLGLGAIEMAIITEEFGRIGFSGLALTLHGQRTLLKLGTPAQQQKYIPGLTRGELLSAIVVSEPDVGSSLKHMKTTAKRNGDHYIVNGLKHHITLGDEASLYITFTLTEKGLTTLLMDRHSPGIHVKKLDAIGWCLEPHYEVEFDDVRVPADHLLGGEGQGIQTFFASFNLTRICNASHLIGVARSAIEDAVRYATRRNVGDSKVADFQGIQWMIAELAVKLQTAQLVRDKAAWMEDAGLSMRPKPRWRSCWRSSLSTRPPTRRSRLSADTAATEPRLSNATCGTRRSGTSPADRPKSCATTSPGRCCVNTDTGRQRLAEAGGGSAAAHQHLRLCGVHECAVIIYRTSSGSMRRPIQTRSRSSAKDSSGPSPSSMSA